jgi:hypothetical protein
VDDPARGALSSPPPPPDTGCSVAVLSPIGDRATPVNITPSTLVEVSRGRMKPLGKCSPIERRRALVLGEQRMELIARWRRLLDLLDEAWIPQTDFVMRMCAHDIPDNLTVPQMEDEVQALEAMLKIKRLGMENVN